MRDYWYETILQRDTNDNNVAKPLRDIRISVFNPGGSTLQTIYAGRTGGTTKTNPFTTGDDGFADFFAESGGYDIKIEDTQGPARIATKTIFWSAVSGEAGGIPASQLAGSIPQSLLAAVLQEALWSPGDIKARGGAAVPSGWLACDGAAVSRTTYAALYAALGGAASPWGQGNGSTTFNTPDLRGRVPVGVDGTAGRLAANDALGETGGAPTVTLDATMIPAHTHSDGTLTAAASGQHDHEIQTQGDGAASGVGQWSGEFQKNSGTSVGRTQDAASHTHDVTGATGSVGGGSAHNNLQPYGIINFIIKT